MPDDLPRPLGPGPPPLWARVALVVAVVWTVAGRLLPFGLTLVLAPSTIDPRGRLRLFHWDPRVGQYLNQFHFWERFRDIALIAVALGIVLTLLWYPVASVMRSRGWWRLPLLGLAAITVAWSELFLIPLLQWADQHAWFVKLLHPLFAAIDTHLDQRSTVPTAYLLLKGIAWLILATGLLPGGPGPYLKHLPWRGAHRAAIGAWIVTVWSLGSLIPTWSQNAKPVIELRPWGFAHLAVPLQFWSFVAAMALLAGVLARSVVVYGGLDLARLDWRPPDSHHEVHAHRWWHWPLALGLIAVLGQPLYLWIRAIGFTVEYPDLGAVVWSAGQFKTEHFRGFFHSYGPYPGIGAQAALMAGRVLVEVMIAWGAALVLRRFRHQWRITTMLAVVAIATATPMMVAPGLAWHATHWSLATWPWPPAVIGLPVAIYLLTGIGTEFAADDPGRELRIALVLLALVGFVAGWLDQSPLLLPPSGTEHVLWPTVLVSKVMLSVDGHFPERLAWGLAWQLPPWIAALATVAIASRLHHVPPATMEPDAVDTPLQS